MVSDTIACGCTDYSNPEMVVEDSEKSEEASSKIKMLDIKRGNLQSAQGTSRWDLIVDCPEKQRGQEAD